MNRMKVAVVAVSVWGLLAGGFASSALAGEGGHVKEVIKHAKEALEHAKESMKHAEESLAHAEEAQHHSAKKK